jgi:hypothetical protein
MKGIISAACAVATGFGCHVAAITTASAMPVPATKVETASNATPVVHRGGFYAVGGVYYYNGHRGYRYARHGYRYHNGYWFPAAAFAAGALAGTAFASPPPPVRPAPAVRLAAAHIRWCNDRYISYFLDNTYQPYEGPRRQCWSPYS